MKAAFLFPALLAATQFVGSASAAEPSVKSDTVTNAKTEAKDASTAARDAEIIKRYDTNKDGKLDDAEIAAVKEKTLMASMEKKEERLERVKERQAELLKEFDKNADGKLDDTEKAAMNAEFRARVEKRPQVLKRLDTDGDGKLSDAEWAAGKEKIIERMQEGKKPGNDKVGKEGKSK